MREYDFAELVRNALYVMENADEEICSITHYCDEGMLTSSERLVVKLNDGSQFQITVVQVK